MKNHQKTVSNYHPKTRFFYINLFLIALAVTFLVLYIININTVAVLGYSLNSEKAKLAKLNALNESLAENEQVSMEELAVLAKDRNMIEVQNYHTFFQDSGVALTQR